MLKIAYRTAAPNTVLCIGADIVKKTSPTAHLLVTPPGGGERRVEYTAFENLSAAAVALANFDGDMPGFFKGDKTHTWDNGALIDTGWQPPAPPEE